MRWLIEALIASLREFMGKQLPGEEEEEEEEEEEATRSLKSIAFTDFIIAPGKFPPSLAPTEHEMRDMTAPSLHF